ncbi:sap49 [Candida margitis]|uniref:sap49 n=1 Tax=Candida margitis TaxID=1775924 RepID=UPI0022276A68|nr:sap49 [Candida margitis]KAI5950520.1 sap49 [Candida margitis]
MLSIFRKLPDSERNTNASLYFGNIDPQCSELLMFELFVQFGPIKNINMPKDRVLKSHQGYGFVEFKNSLDAKYAEDILRGVRLYGKLLKLKKLDSKPQTPQSRQQVGTFVSSKSELLSDKYIDVGARVFINNLNPLIDEKFLMNTFSKFGTVIKQPEVKRDLEGNSMGFGFVTFGDFETSDLVIEKLNNTILMNSKVSLAYAFKNELGKNGKKIRHGDEAERKLAANAKKNNLLRVKSSNRVSKKGNSR